MADEDLDERMSRRFGDTETTDDDDSETDMSSTTSETAQKDSNAQNEGKTVNVKKEWNVRSFYLSDDLDSELTTAFKRLDLELSEANAGVDLKKTRHFYPLLVELGLERLEKMDVTEVTERLEE
ncbi:MAG: hypothetical protein ABEI98_03865 [Halorhabdus sp.]